MTEKALLKIYGHGEVDAADLGNFLFNLAQAYNGIVSLQYLAEGKVEPKYEFNYTNIRAHADMKGVPLDEEDRLILRSVSLHSPGVWEFFGNLNPLQAIFGYLNDRHERRKDVEYRIPAEKRRLYLENKMLELDVVNKYINIAQTAGVPEQVTSELFYDLIKNPLLEVSDAQDKAIISTAEIVILNPEGDPTKQLK